MARLRDSQAEPEDADVRLRLYQLAYRWTLGPVLDGPKPSADLVAQVRADLRNQMAALLGHEPTEGEIRALRVHPRRLDPASD